jgi:hypothetical protein
MAWLPIPFDVEFLDSDGLPITGAAPTITIRNSSGTAVITGAAMTEYVSETGAAYYYDYTPLAAGTYRGSASTADPDASRPVILIGNATAVEESSGATPAEISDAVWSHDPRSLTSPTLTFNTPFLRGNPLDIEIIRGDSYLSSDGRAIEWTVSTPTDITDADIVLEMRSLDAPNDVLTFEGTATFISGDQWTIKFELTSTDTIGLNTRQNGPGPTYYAAPVAVFSDEIPVRRVTLIKRVNVFVDGTPSNL